MDNIWIRMAIGNPLQQMHYCFIKAIALRIVMISFRKNAGISGKFQTRRYTEEVISEAFTRAINQDCKRLFYSDRKKKSNSSRFVFSFKYSPLAENNR